MSTTPQIPTPYFLFSNESFLMKQLLRMAALLGCDLATSSSYSQTGFLLDPTHTLNAAVKVHARLYQRHVNSGELCYRQFIRYHRCKANVVTTENPIENHWLPIVVK